MSKAVLASIRPVWCEKIASRRKSLEIRKNRPKLEPPFKVYIYCTKRKGFVTVNKNSEVCDCKVIGEFVCDRIFPIRIFNNGTIQDWNHYNMKDSCVPYDDIVKYIGNNQSGYGWHISDLVIYEKPKELTEFYKVGTLNASDFEYQLYDGRRSYADYLFTRAMRKPPLSWCYVEVV